MNEKNFGEEILETIENTVNRKANKEQDKIINKLINSGLEYKEAFSIFNQIKIETRNELVRKSIEKINIIKNSQ